MANVGLVDSSPINDIQKKMRRAERFGTPVQPTEEEKRKSRAQRFGIGTTVLPIEAVKQSEEQKRNARAQRFGTGMPSVTSDEEVKKKARLERFGSFSKSDPLEEERRKERAIRFADTPSNSPAQMNVAGNIQPVPVVGEASGGA